MIGKGHSGALVTLVDRMSKRVLIQRVPRKTAAVVGDAIRTMRTPYPVHTITADNGKEFAGHEAVATAWIVSRGPVLLCASVCVSTVRRSGAGTRTRMDGSGVPVPRVPTSGGG